MDQLQAQVARARRRLVIEQFLGRSIWCLLAAISLAAAAIALPRVFIISNLPENWDTIWLVGAFAAGFGGALAWTLIARRSALDAAVEIDRRFELRERIASSLSLTPDDQSSDAGRALVSDAARAVQRIDVGDKFRVRLDRRAWWPLAPAVVMFVLLAFFDNRQAQSSSDPNSPAGRKQTKTSLESLRERIAEQQKKNKPGELPIADDVFKQIEEGTKELTENKQPDRTKAMVKLNDLAKQLDDRRQQLGAKDELQKQFEKMSNLGGGPGDKAAQAMKEGDWQRAKDEIAKLEKQLQDGKLDDKAKQDLANQLEQMKDKLEAAANARQQAMDDLKKQIDQQKQQGNMAKAGELQQKLDKLQQQQQQMNQMQKLAQQMAQAQQALKQGDAQKAAAAMAQMAQQMQQMQQDQKEMQALDAMMNQLELAKDMMACEKCNGAGCEACQGNQFAMNMGGRGKNDNGKPGPGMGEGRGNGPRPEQRNQTNLRDTQVRQKVGRGGAVLGGMVEGPNIKGEVAEAIKKELEAAGAEPADPLTSERLSPARQEQARLYFEALREGR